jgi:hypothetical protein
LGTPKVAFSTVTVDAQTQLNTLSTLLSVPFTTVTGFVDVLATFSYIVAQAVTGAPNRGEFQLSIDGNVALAVPSGASTGTVPPNSGLESGAISRVFQLPPGPHTITVEWRNTTAGGTLAIQAASNPQRAHGSLRVMDVLPGL